MALTRSPIESDRAKTLAMMAMITVFFVLIIGLGWLTRPVLTSRDAGIAATGASTISSAADHVRGVAAVQGGPVDIGFAQDMSLHHEQALTMAHMALAKASPRVRQLAQGIVMQQLKEIGYMQGWLMLWQAPGIADTDDMRWMRDAYVHSVHRDPAYDQFIDSCIKGEGMPGRATPTQLETLASAASPEAFDGMFLALMVRHHQGAVVMARFASEHAGLELVRGFARSIAAEQQQEMAQMLKWLRA
jgi:uncharacterized protein (DUF305 family)